MAKKSCCKRREWASTSCLHKAPHALHKAPHALHKAPHDLVRRVYLSNAKAYKHEWGIAGKLSPWPFDSCKLQCDTEHAIVAALRKARKGHVNGDPGLNRTSAWPIYMYTGQDRGVSLLKIDKFDLVFPNLVHKGLRHCISVCMEYLSPKQCTCTQSFNSKYSPAQCVRMDESVHAYAHLTLTFYAVCSFSGFYCPQLPSTVANGIVIGSDKTLYNDSVTFGCNRGAYITGTIVGFRTATLTCLGNATWSEEEPTCTRKAVTLACHIFFQFN